ncbi:type I-B CRISPR-associated protein Cas7/Cst2/DevR [Saccharibacillus endophyticus]|uniref:Type I-B CRISPR-associated protein Cas7/Cst2/DevR n=1 Tax=Saccharibacillus endophyticus TaxID=2060666 RepID=A0ABQ1ZTI4_9BACL|nr:type I-B CRISPR-associated protein Cas7/Cst2/DevR [Saccharibacillus endophyticus]GGH78280.1 type I-B CRISPR-associated protein Cas7/Cst2/DevR [Saccharibacillus endophyticus]
MSKALTLSLIFKANSLNYGEGIANISELKKIHRGNGDVLTFASRQSLRYDIVRLGNEWFDWNLDVVDKSKGTLQFQEALTIADSVEMDLFGYLKTNKNSMKRPAVARLSHAISLEPYRSDIEFLNNMGLAERIGETPNLANIEQHESFYAYTITLDLKRVGIDPADKKNPVSLPVETRKERLGQFLDIVKLLNRNIRGRQESLAPLFVIGGVYPAANPFFLGRLMLEPQVKAWKLNTEALKEAAQTTFGGQEIANSTHLGYVSGIFQNEANFNELGIAGSGSIEYFFQTIQAEAMRALEELA